MKYLKIIINLIVIAIFSASIWIIASKWFFPNGYLIIAPTDIKFLLMFALIGISFLLLGFTIDGIFSESAKTPKAKSADNTKNLKTISALFNLSNAINSIKALDELYPAIHKALEEIIDAQNFFIALVNKEKNVIEFPYFVDKYDQDYDDIPLDSPSSLTVKVIKERKALFFSMEELDSFVDKNEIIGAKSKVWLGAPIIKDKEVIGAIVVQSYDDENFYTSNDAPLLCALCDQVSVAIARTTAEISLNQQFKLLLKVIDTIPNPIYFEDREQNCKFANFAFIRLCSNSFHEMIGKKVSNFLPKNISEMLEEKNLQLLKDNNEQLFDFQITQSNGMFQYIGRKIPAFDDQNKLIGIVNFFYDMTEIIEAQNAVERSAERFKDLANMLPQPTVEISMNGQFLFANKAALDTFKVQSESELNSLNLYDFFKQEDKAEVEQKFKINISTLDDFVEEYTLIKRDGGEFPAIIYCNVIIENEKPIGVRALVIDVTKQKQFENEIKKSLEKERELNVIKSKFVATMSHEYRTPMASIMLAVEMLQNHYEKLQQDDKENLFKRIHNAIKRTTSILDDVLFINKAEFDSLESNREVLAFSKVVDVLVFELSQIIPENFALINDSIKDDKEVNIDLKLTSQAVKNIISNSVKFSTQNKTIEFRANIENEFLIIMIRDYGIGIPESDLDRAFEPFYRGKNVGAISGLGLSLSIAKLSIEAQKGSVALGSKEGKGTTVIIKLPIA